MAADKTWLDKKKKETLPGTNMEVENGPLEVENGPAVLRFSWREAPVCHAT